MVKKKKDKKMDIECGCRGCGGGCAGPQDVMHGINITYDPKTGLCVEANYDSGLQHGGYTEYYDIESEFIKTRGFYERGLKQGQWIYYNKKGEVQKLETYKKGRLVK